MFSCSNDSFESQLKIFLNPFKSLRLKVTVVATASYVNSHPNYQLHQHHQNHQSCHIQTHSHHHHQLTNKGSPSKAFSIEDKSHLSASNCQPSQTTPQASLTIKVGHVTVGSKEGGMEAVHWKQALHAARKPLCMWHRLRPL